MYTHLNIWSLPIFVTYCNINTDLHQTLFSQDHFDVNPDVLLASEQKAVGHAITSMLENHTAIAGFYWRYGYHMEEFYNKVLIVIIFLISLPPILLNSISISN